MNNFHNKVIYQIYPKSFYDTNNDGIGDLKGVTAKLPYLSELGVDCIWLTPFFISPQNDNGYDVADYYNIESMYGNMQDFDELSKLAKSYGIEIMLDMVFNHTSTKHEWFQKALKNDSKYQEFYFFKKGDQNVLPTNWESKFGGNAWEYIEELGMYYLHLFDKTQADLNWENPLVREEMAKIVRFWMNKGVAGFRFDVVNLISKPEIFEDDDEGDGRRFYTDGRHVHQFLKELNLNSYASLENAITVGEMSSTSLENCIKYAGADSNELSMVFSFHHLKVDYKNKQKWELQPFDFIELKQILIEYQLGMQEKNAWNALFWCNHDQPRVLSRFGDDKNYPKESGKMLATSIHMLRGTPYIYQGEEIGMTNAYFTDIQQYKDVESLNYYEILKKQGIEEDEIYKILLARSRDNSRTPMQWDDSENAGFTNGKPWISVINNYKTINTKNSMEDPNSIFHHYKKLIQLRKTYPIIAEGTISFLEENHPQIFAYERFLNHQKLLVINNFYAEECQLNINLEGYKLLLSNYSDMEKGKLRAYESIILIK